MGLGIFAERKSKKSLGPQDGDEISGWHDSGSSFLVLVIFIESLLFVKRRHSDSDGNTPTSFYIPDNFIVIVLYSLLFGDTGFLVSGMSTWSLDGHRIAK